MKANNQKTLSVKLKPEIKEKLMHLSKVKERSPHWIMNKAITAYVEQEDKNEQLREETLELLEQKNLKASSKLQTHCRARLLTTQW